MRAYIVSIGSELIGGHLTDTNATYLAQELAAQGVELLHVIQVGDDLQRLTRVLSMAAADADLVVCTGGIGPTDDDLTREAIAALAGETPVVDEDAVADIREFFAQRGLEMPERNAKQAWVIPSAEILPNPVGTAPGWLARIDKTSIVAMPGVPREMFRMWREQALPRISSQLSGMVYRSSNLRTLGIGESAVSELLGELTRRPQPYIGTYAKDDGVHVRVTASAADVAQAQAALDETVVEVRQRLAEYIYADDDRPLPRVILDALRERGLTLSIIEKGTGGRFGALLLSEPIADGAILGANAEPTAANADSPLALAQAARTRFGSTVGMGLTAVVEPLSNGRFEGVIGVAIDGAVSGEATFPIRAAFAEIQRRAALNAADVLRRALQAEQG
jgi:nicotinamide-nucleotide amidase